MAQRVWLRAPGWQHPLLHCRGALQAPAYSPLFLLQGVWLGVRPVRRVSPPRTASHGCACCVAYALVGAAQATTSNAESYKKLTDAHPSVTVHYLLFYPQLLWPAILHAPLAQCCASSRRDCCGHPQWPKLLNAPLAEVDPEVTDIIEKEKNRQWKARLALYQRTRCIAWFWPGGCVAL